MSAQRGEDHRAVAFSPDGARLAFIRLFAGYQGFGVWTVDAAGGDAGGGAVDGLEHSGGGRGDGGGGSVVQWMIAGSSVMMRT